MKTNTFIFLLLVLIFVIVCVIIHFAFIDDIDMYVISLRHEPRLKNIKDQELLINKRIQIFDAVKGDKLNIQELANSGILDQSMNSDDKTRKREIGCYLSHQKLYEQIRNYSKTKYSIIFEDDFKILSETFYNDIEDILQKMSDKNIDFDMIFLGNLSSSYGEHIVDNIHYITKNTNGLAGTHSILINNKNINKIIEHTKYIDNPIDWKIGNLANENKLTILILNPSICVQLDTLVSTIHDTNMIENYI
jgi:GR25 family glycosyltransferase involved in LPS biosynthesis